MGLFSKSYEPGGEYHIMITDVAFEDAILNYNNDENIRDHFKQVAKDGDCLKYEAHDFPVTEMLALFMLSFELQEEDNGVPEDLKIKNIQLGRKDTVEYQNFCDKYNARLEQKEQYNREDNEHFQNKGLGGKLFSLAAGAAVKGIKKAATGDSEDVRWFKNTFSNYICGESEKARNYINKFAVEFGGYDEGLTSVAGIIRESFWISEFAKKNRS